MNRIEEIERKLDQLLKETDNSKLFNEIGILLYQMKDWKNAEMYFRRAYELKPDDDDILYNYALLLYFNSQWEKSLPVLRAYLKLHHDDLEIMEKVGDSYYQLGDYESAVKINEKLQVKKGES